MKSFGYAVVSSILHDKLAVDAIAKPYAGMLSSLGGFPMEAMDVSPSRKPAVILVLTGGSEKSALEIAAACRLQDPGSPPVGIFAHPLHNSLPASLEILAKLKSDGISGRIIFAASGADRNAERDLSDFLTVRAAIDSMSASRIGTVGEPSDWLVASSQDGAAVGRTWKAALVPVPMQELKDEIGAARAARRRPEAQSEPLNAFVEGAASVREAGAGDFAKSESIRIALSNIVKRRSLDAFTLRCFDLVVDDESTGCYALSSLADDGIDAGCEGDIPSILGLRLARLLSGKPGWMANPASISFDGAAKTARILLAHCTVPLSLVSGYGIRSHFESGLGTAIAGRFEPGEVTLFRVGGQDLRRLWIAEGRLTASHAADGLCRTQVTVELEDSKVRTLLDDPLGNHLILASGKIGKLLKSFAEFMGLQA